MITNGEKGYIDAEIVKKKASFPERQTIVGVLLL